MPGKGSANGKTAGLRATRIAAAGQRVASINAATIHIIVLPAARLALNGRGTSAAARIGHAHHAGLQ